jgi:hypothetical protein
MFEKYSNVKFHENPFIGSRVVPCGRRDGHDETNSRFHNVRDALKINYNHNNIENSHVLLPNNLSLQLVLLLI